MEIRLDQIDPDALRIVQRLRRYQHKAYLVGGCVRDLLLGRRPKDFDVATSATPDQIRRSFRNCRIIGRRFRLAHVFFGRKIIEIATFRANPRTAEDENGDTPGDEKGTDLLIRQDNVFGTAEEDARRRDFTINGLFFDVDAVKVIDHVGGLPDLEARVLRTIGDPDIRFREDPVRILRAVKFAARCGLTVEPETYRRMMEHKAELAKCAQARVTEEFYRLLRAGAAHKSFELLVETGLLQFLLPELDEALKAADTDAQVKRRCERFWAYLRALDESILARDETPTDAVILATLLLPPLRDALAPDAVPTHNIAQVVSGSVQPMLERLKASRRDSEVCRQILLTLRYLLPGSRRRHPRLGNRPFYQEALWLAAVVARAEDVVLPAELSPVAGAAPPAGDAPGEAAAAEEELPAELLVDVEGEPGRDRRARYPRRERNGRGVAAVPTIQAGAAASELPLRDEKPSSWEPGPRVRTPIPDLDQLGRAAGSRPAFLGVGTFSSRWALRIE